MRAAEQFYHRERPIWHPLASCVLLSRLALILCFALAFFDKLEAKTGRKPAPQPSTLTLALKAEKARNIEEGIKLFKMALDEKLSRDDRALALIGLLRAQNALGQQFYFGSKDRVESRNLFAKNLTLSETFLKTYPEKVEAWFAHVVTSGNLALLSGAGQKVRLARNIEKHLKHAEQIDPTFAYTYLARGIFFVEISRVSAFERWLAQWIWGDLPTGTVLDAERELRYSLSLDPHFLLTRFHLAQALLKLDRPSEALKEFHEILKRPSLDYNDDLWKKMSQEFIKDLEP